jgi:NADP-dependent 3-hydroxy acid dehydrogenase YdfG
MKDFEGEVGLVTGASSGMGAGIARLLGELGLTVVLSARREAELNRVAQDIEQAGGRAVVMPVDLSEWTQLDGLVDRVHDQVGPVDILVNGAGIVATGPIHELNMDSWDSVIDLNLRAPAVLCSRVLPAMRARGRGFIINLSSEAGAFVYPGMGVYCVSKHALRVLTELIQEENQKLGIKAWAICPGEVATDRVRNMDASGNLERFLEVQDITDVIRSLLTQRPQVKIGPVVLVRTMLNPHSGA